MTDVDPRIVEPLKNNYFKACSDYCNHQLDHWYFIRNSAFT